MTTTNDWPAMAAGIEALEWIVANRTARRLRWEGEAPILVDLQTAAVMLDVRGRLLPTNRRLMDERIALGAGYFLRMADFAWRHA
mgnify:CR=1 FL=1